MPNRFRGTRRWLILALGATAGVGAAVTASSPSVFAQQLGPPVTGTIALEGTMEKFYKGVNVFIVKTSDGIEHMVYFTKNLLIHGGPVDGTLADLQEGRTVVVHYKVIDARATAEEIDRLDDGLKITEGTVVRISRSRREITIRFANGTTETLRLTERAAADAGPGLENGDPDLQVKVFYSDEHGQKVVHYFRRATPAK
jgi:hypothetical protein